QVFDPLKRGSSEEGVIKYSPSMAFSINIKLLLTDPEDVAVNAFAVKGVKAPTMSKGIIIFALFFIELPLRHCRLQCTFNITHPRGPPGFIQIQIGFTDTSVG